MPVVSEMQFTPQECAAFAVLARDLSKQAKGMQSGERVDFDFMVRFVGSVQKGQDTTQTRTTPPKAVDVLAVALAALDAAGRQAVTAALQAATVNGAIPKQLGECANAAGAIIKAASLSKTSARSGPITGSVECSAVSMADMPVDLGAAVAGVCRHISFDYGDDETEAGDDA